MRGCMENYKHFYVPSESRNDEVSERQVLLVGRRCVGMLV
jgi:hypothetical protein